MQLELEKAKEKVIYLEECLERRRKANSHKEAELRQKEDALEAVSALAIHRTLISF